MLRVIDSGGQAALLAPTEVLAQQHHRSITALLGDLAAGGMLGGAEDGTTVALLTGSMTKTQRTPALLDIASGQAGIVIGTHALLEDQVSFADLGMVVVDEQHRFGVEQRAALDRQGVHAAARAGDDRDADPEDRGDDGVRRPRGVDAVRAAGRAGADPDQRRAARRAARLEGPGLGAPRRGGRQGPPGLRRVPAHRRRRARAGRGGQDRLRRGRQPVAVPGSPRVGHRGGRHAARRTARRAPARRPARAAARRREGPHDAGLRRRRPRRAGQHHGDRGRGRRRQRDRHGDPRRRPVRRQPAPPAPRPGRPRRASTASACW